MEGANWGRDLGEIGLEFMVYGWRHYGLSDEIHLTL